MPVLSFLPEPGSVAEAYTKRLASMVFACVVGSAFSAFFFSTAFGGDGVAWFLFLSGASLLAAPVVVLPLFFAERKPSRSCGAPDALVPTTRGRDNPHFSRENPPPRVAGRPDLRVVSCAAPGAGVAKESTDLAH